MSDDPRVWIIEAHGKLCLQYVQPSRRLVIYDAVATTGESWRTLRRCGWRAVRARISKEPTP
jgi:hypothetical protein